jgi:hypothetical protein
MSEKHRNTPSPAHASAVVPGFERVTVAPGLACPNCTKEFGAHSLRHDGQGEVQLRCAGCGRDAISATLVMETDDDLFGGEA